MLESSDKTQLWPSLVGVAVSQDCVDDVDSASGQSDQGWRRTTLPLPCIFSERTIAQYMSGDLEMPLERQLCLAQFLIDNVPALARTGHNLLGQTRAAIRFNGTETAVHPTAPVPNARSF